MIKTHGSDPYKMCLCTFDFFSFFGSLVLCRRLWQIVQYWRAHGVSLSSPVKDSWWMKDVCASEVAIKPSLQDCFEVLFVDLFCFACWSGKKKKEATGMHYLYCCEMPAATVRCFLLADGTHDCEASNGRYRLFIPTELICFCAQFVCFFPPSISSFF